MAKAKRPKDSNERAVQIAKISTGEIEDPIKETDLIKLAASAMGRKGGLAGGKARAAKLSSRERVEIAKKGANKRWGKS